MYVCASGRAKTFFTATFIAATGDLYGCCQFQMKETAITKKTKRADIKSMGACG